jgi:phage baseplate assembly protein W
VLRVTDPYGLDVSTFPGLDVAFKAITGQRAIAEAVARRWVTPRGSLVYDPDYGEDVRGLLNARIDGPRLRALEAALTAQALADERISGAVVQLAVTGSGPTVALRASASLASSAGPFRLVLTVTQLALDLEVLRA